MKGWWILSHARLAGVVLLSALGVLSCSKNSADRLRVLPPGDSLSCNVPPTGVLQVINGGQPEQFRGISDEGEWCALWNQIYSIYAPAPTCDTNPIDFTSEVALVAAIGGRPDGCFGVKIDCVHRDSVSDSLTVYVTESVPGAACICTQSFINPIDVVKVSRPVGLTTFIQQTVTVNCG